MMAAARLLALFLWLFTAACDSPGIVLHSPSDEAAYRFALNTTPPLVYRWNTGQTIHVYVVEGDDPLRTRILKDSVFLPAASAWEATVLYREFRFGLTDRLDEADVLLAWSDEDLPLNVDDCAPPPGDVNVTVFCLSDEMDRLRPYRVQAPDTALTSVRMIVLIRGTLSSDVAHARRLGAHELGHVLGIGGHSSNSADVMFASPATDTPSAADIATVRLLYHTTPDILP